LERVLLLVSIVGLTLKMTFNQFVLENLTPQDQLMLFYDKEVREFATLSTLMNP
jgi:hypothetical protein